MFTKLRKGDGTWTIKDSKKLYRIDTWGSGYFGINKAGRMTIMPQQNETGPVCDMGEIIDEIKDQKISFPVVVRFHDILRNEVIRLNETFSEVIASAGYRGKYYGVYPIKVNQMREVVEEILDAGDKYNYGLEAGSKSELLSVLAFNENRRALTILNGYKDQDYLRLALLGRKLRRKMVIVVEKFSELIETIELADKMNVRPLIGLRAKLATQGSGRWASSGGERAKFGLTPGELLNAVKYLKDKGKKDSAVLFHFHVGSQITDIRSVKAAVTEGTRIYTQLVKLGLPLKYFDVGGGLGVDYDGSRSTIDSSINYTVRDYIEDVIYIIKQICDIEKIEHPHIVSESGRAITAKHACVLVKVFDQINPADFDYPITRGANEHILVTNMRQLLEELGDKNYQETYNDILQIKEEGRNAFQLGILSLEERAKIESMFWRVCSKLSEIVRDLEFIPEELKDLDDYLAKQYLCNCSFFQSVPDSWAINQLFPIMPVMRLNERPSILGTLADSTCDSDGKIDEFISITPTSKSLPLHSINPGEDYYLGIFLTGAYQDVMGDMHNLFGKLNEVHIFADDEDPTDFYIEEVIEGDNSEDVLADMQYNPKAMAYTIKKHLDKEVQFGNLLPKEGVRLIDFYEACLKSYTYLKK